MTAAPRREAHTPGPWRAIPQGGSSTVVAMSKPVRNDTRIPPYGWDEKNGHCIAYPFIEDGGSVRWDFVSFSHEDARLIAAAPALLEALQEMVDLATPNIYPQPDKPNSAWAKLLRARAALRQASGGG